MAAGKEIRSKIKSVENTRKITKAMEMVAASKMRKSQECMHAARPYAEKIRDLVARLAAATTGHVHPLMAKNESAESVGFVVVTTDKGLCGGMNTNLLRAVTARFGEVDASGRKCEVVAIGNKGLGFLNRIGARVLSHATQLGDKPMLEKLIGPTKLMLDAYAAGRLSAVHLCYTRFVNTIRQEPVIQQLLPLSAQPVATGAAQGGGPRGPDYLFEPDAQSLIEQVLLRYAEALVFRAVAENMASEQAARMVAMKAATDNGGDVIAELTLLHNRTRQAAITRELSEIVGGAAAV